MKSKPAGEMHVSGCADCNHTAEEKFTECPKCGSTHVHSTTQTKYQGGATRVARGHIVEARHFDNKQD